MLIRTAQLADVRRIAEIHVATWRQAYQGIVPDTFLRSLSVDEREGAWRALLEKTDSELLVATDEPSQELAGWVSFGRCRDADKPSSTGELWAIYVDPDYWSRGVGRLLWLAARDRLIEMGFSEVTLWCLAGNQRGDRFYRAAGFIPTTIKEFPLGGAMLEEVRYEVVLSPLS